MYKIVPHKAHLMPYEDFSIKDCCVKQKNNEGGTKTI